MVLSLLFSRQYHPIPMSSKSPFWARTNLCLVIIGIFYGSLVAGMKAGLIYNSFPLMEGSWIPGEILNLKPLWLNLFENSTTVQFIHRIFAFCILVSACFGASRNWATPWYMFAVLGQIFIGVFTLLYHVPVFLGTLHQGFGVIVFSLAFWCYLKHRNFEVQKFN
jgi:cytochrome c oxidase assembly protein subunit 15